MTGPDRRARVTWLLAHPDLWVGAPSDTQDVDDEGRAVLMTLAEHMIAAGLYSGKTPARDRLWALRKAIGQARRAQGVA